MSTYAPEPTVDVTAPRSERMPAPGREAVGPTPVDFVLATREAVRAELELARIARMESRERLYELTKQGQSDSNGDLFLELFSVPGGATGHLMRCAVDMAGVTPAAPVTSANLWLAIVAQSSAGMTAPPTASAVQVGSLLHFSPVSVAADAQIPCLLVDAEHPESAPTLVGPATFYLQVDATTAARQLAARFSVLVRQPEP